MALVQLPRAPEAVAAEAAAAAQAEHRKAAAAAAGEEAAVRQLRMLLRDITSAMLCTRRWQAFAEPVHPEEDPEYWQRVRQWDLLTCQSLSCVSASSVARSSESSRQGS